MRIVKKDGPAVFLGLPLGVRAMVTVPGPESVSGDGGEDVDTSLHLTGVTLSRGQSITSHHMAAGCGLWQVAR